MLRRLCLFLALCLCLPLVACAPKEEGYIPYNYDLSEYIRLGDYRTLSVKKSDVTPTEKELEEQTEADFVLLTRLTDRAVKLGDKVNLNYLASFEGTQYDDDTEAGFFLTLGENALGIPGFDEGLVGATPGDSIALDLAFPSDYEKNPDYAGKDVSFVVTVNYIYSPLPALNDEMVKTFTTYKTVAEYEEGIFKTLTEVKTIEAVWNQLLDATTVLQYPEKEYENYYTEYLDGYTSLAQNYGMTLSELIKESGSTMDEFYREADETTKSYIKEDLVVYAIARQENLTLSEEEYKQAVQDYFLSSAYDYYVSAELMEQTLGKEILSQQFLSNKVLDFILEHATVTEN